MDGGARDGQLDPGQEPRVLKAPAPTVEVATLGAISTTLTVQVWMANRDFGGARGGALDAGSRAGPRKQAAELAFLQP
jgi:hypothetical protein